VETLVLNAAYQPIAVVTWREAITKLHAEKASDRVEVVLAYEDKVLHSAHATHQMPSVVRHIRFRKQKAKGIKFSRDNIWARDRGRCQYCGIQVQRETYTYDHVIPKSRGGKTTWENIVASCSSCNGKKGDSTPDEAKMRLKTVPVKPTSLPDEFRRGLRWKKGMPDTWKAWFGGYWHGSAEEESK
jgi:5-methylcytosine-specific restriction endonuclease McrA